MSVAGGAPVDLVFEQTFGEGARIAVRKPDIPIAADFTVTFIAA
jgi:hypothetical protein